MKGWRTILINGGIAALGVILPDVVNQLDGATAAVVIAIINGVLRPFTTTPIGRKQ